jgi:molybdopterin/thiamine biosynthesis adenylyltransferase
MKARCQGKSILPELLKQYGFDKAESGKEKTVVIIFDELRHICEIRTYSTDNTEEDLIR